MLCHSMFRACPAPLAGALSALGCWAPSRGCSPASTRRRCAVSLLLALFIVHSAGAAQPLPRSAPEQQGVSSAALLEFVTAADTQVDVMNSLMLVRHGHVIAEGWWAPYDAASPNELYSLSKSFTSTAVGLAIHEGKLSLDDEVVKVFADDAPAEPSNHLKAMRLRDLLCMSTGHQTEPPLRGQEAPWTKVFLAHPVEHKPGTHFLYNTPATYMQSAMVQKATGMTVLEYLRPRLFEPLGIENPTWGASAQGITLGGYGLNLRTEDIAKFGQLYLQRGAWQGRQLVPAAWVDAATARQVSNGSNPLSDWDQGYGYQFWRSRHGCYRGDGAFGQYCLVMPEQDAVLVITSGVRDMQGVLNLVWQRLWPALQSAPLPPDPSAAERLHAKLASLSVPLVRTQAQPAASERLGKRFQVAANDQQVESITLAADGQEYLLTVRAQGQEQQLSCGRDAWRRGRFTLAGQLERPVAASGAWTAENVYTAKLCFYETPFYVTLQLKFDGDKLHYSSETNAGFGPTRRAELVGQLAP